MNIQIRKNALDLLFRVILSCKCPLKEIEEESIFNLFRKLKSGETLDYNELLGIFKENTETVIHRLVDFSIWFASTDSKPLIIEREHVLRHFASSYHWNYVVGESMPNAYKKVISISSWFISHMLLPVKINIGSDESVTGTYRFNNSEIKLKNLFLPPEFDFDETKIYCSHFASVLTHLSLYENLIVQMLIDANKLFIEFRQEINEIDYHRFERFGNYNSVCVNRHKKYYE